MEQDPPAISPAWPPSARTPNISGASRPLNIVTWIGRSAGNWSSAQLTRCETGRLSQRETSPSPGLPVARTICQLLGNGRAGPPPFVTSTFASAASRAMSAPVAGASGAPSAISSAMSRAP